MIVFVLLIAVPIAASAVRYWAGDHSIGWQDADRSSAGLLPTPRQHPEALVRVFAARTVRWRGIFAVHSWIVVKAKDASAYTRYDYTAWGDPIRVNGFVADGRWFGGVPQTLVAMDGDAAEQVIPKIRAAIDAYRYRSYGDYRAWPGPNSNTFVRAVLDTVPELSTALPPTAIGKDFPYDGRWFELTGSSVRATIGGYLGITLGWNEGVEINFLGAVLVIDLRRPAIKLPGLGRLGMAAQS